MTSARIAPARMRRFMSRRDHGPAEGPCQTGDACDSVRARVMPNDARRIKRQLAQAHPNCYQRLHAGAPDVEDSQRNVPDPKPEHARALADEAQRREHPDVTSCQEDCGERLHSHPARDESPGQSMRRRHAWK